MVPRKYKWQITQLVSIPKPQPVGTTDEETQDPRIEAFIKDVSPSGHPHKSSFNTA
jgi:hypothetical protein